MAHVTACDGVRLDYEEAGTGTTIVFAHELAGSAMGSNTARRIAPFTARADAVSDQSPPRLRP